MGYVTAMKNCLEKKTALKREEGNMSTSIHVKSSVGGRAWFWEEQSSSNYMDEIVRMDIKKKKNRSDGEVEIHVKKKAGVLKRKN